MNFRELRIKLQSIGVKVPLKFSGRKGGAGPSEGQVIIINGQYISVPTNSWFVDESPYTIIEKGKTFFLNEGSQELCEVLFPKRPNCYDLETGKGVSLEKIALIHGKDCFASTVYQGCAYFEQGCECAFCGIGLSLKNNRTVKEKNPEDLGYAALKAKELDQTCHVTLTTGKRINSHDGTKHLADCVKSIKVSSSLPVHVQVCPVDDETVYKILKTAGADTIGIHVETCSEKILKKIAPAKAALGIDYYIQAWGKAVSVFGRNQVSSFLIAGIGDDLKGIVKSAELMSELGVYPYVLPLRPVPGTRLGRSRPPSPEDMLEIYEMVSGIIKLNGLSSKKSKAGCVRCGACSAITEFE
jgi:radical SAM protein (TIGR04043 family)